MIGKNVTRVWLCLGVALLTLLSACAPTPSATPASSGVTLVAPGSTGTPADSGNGTPTSVPTAVPTVIHLVRPDEPPAGSESQILDTDTSTVASQHHASGGENYNNDLFERPFDQSMNTYYPDLDIQTASLNRAAAWVYVTIALAGQDPQGGLRMEYGLEVDTNLDGRGDYLVMAAAPGASWSTDGVRVWKDGNRDVGGGHPVAADAPPQTGNGYETLLFDQGQGSDPDTAWARVKPGDPNRVQIAFKRTMFPDPGKYLWGAWAVDPAVLHPDWLDYNDHFSQAEAGSPLAELTQYYPLKALYSVDDTCRWSVGFTPTGSEPGICPVPATPTPPPPTPTRTRTPKPTITMGTIKGMVFLDKNNNGKYNPAKDSPIGHASVRVLAGSCGSPGIIMYYGYTISDGTFAYAVYPGIYCVVVDPDPSIPWNQKSPPFSVNVLPGDSVLVDFWYREVIH